MSAPEAQRPWLSHDQAIAQMLARAVDWTSIWADRAFIELSADCARMATDPEACARVIETAGRQCLKLIADTEDLASYLDLTRDQRRAFIADRAGVFRARLERLIAMARGSDA